MIRFPRASASAAALLLGVALHAGSADGAAAAGVAAPGTAATSVPAAAGPPAAGAPEVHPAPGSSPGGMPPGSPPGPPPYQMRSTLPSGDRLSGPKDGEALFSNRCGACHLAGGMGTNLLTKQRVAAGAPPQSGLLANRDDLTRLYVRTIVRRGKLAMPRLTRVEVTDAELDAIARYLGKAGE